MVASSQHGILNKDSSFKHDQGMKICVRGIIRILELVEIPTPSDIQDSVALIASMFTFAEPR